LASRSPFAKRSASRLRRGRSQRLLPLRVRARWADQKSNSADSAPAPARTTPADTTTAAQKKLFFNLRKAKGQIKAIEEGDLRPEQVQQIATKLGVTEEEVISMNRRLAAPDHSLNAPLRADSEGEWQDWLVDDSPNQEALLADQEEKDDRSELLAEGMQALNERERHILTERRLKDDPATLEDLSKEYDISRERVRQIEVRAFEKLQRAIRDAAREKRVGGAVPPAKGKTSAALSAR
jgi:RNA polymerase sigma-32 factor